MAKITTPVSDLMVDEKTADLILHSSDLMEGRDHTPDLALETQGLFHFELNLANVWDSEDRAWVEQIVNKRKILELISFHMTTCCSQPILNGIMFDPGGKMFSRAELLMNAAKNIAWLKKLIARQDIKIAVENNNYYPTPAYMHVTDSEFISQVVADNHIGFLFDLAHARITAVNRTIPYEEYLAGLPMEYVLQIHVSQWNVDAKGMAFDAHEIPCPSLNEEVLTLIKKYSIKYVTIEYYRNSKKLLETLRLYRILLDKETV